MGHSSTQSFTVLYQSSEFCGCIIPSAPANHKGRVGAASMPRKSRVPQIGALAPEAYFLVHSSTQSFTVLYQSSEFCGFSTQCPSSGKYSIFEGIFIRCNVSKS